VIRPPADRDATNAPINCVMVPTRAFVVAAVTAWGYNDSAAVAITEIGGPFWSGRAPTMAERRVSMWATSIKVDD
jgi:hypothetical protein